MRRATLVVLWSVVLNGGSGIPAQTVREKVSVEAITVRLTARNAAGKRVDDLHAADLALTVDGKPVAIDTFAGPEPTSDQRPAPGAGSVEHGQASAPRSLTDEPRTRTLFVVDLAGTHPFDRRDTCAELNRFLHAAGRGGDEFLVASFDGTRLRRETGWTREPEEAALALSRIGSGSALNGVESPGTAAGSICPTGFSSAAWLQLQRERLHGALLEALAAFPHAPGEGRLVLVTAGTAVMRPSDFGTILRCQVTATERTRLLAATSDVSAAHAREIEHATFALWSRAVNPGGDAISMSDVVAKAVERDIVIIPVQAEAFDRGGFDLSGPAPDVRAEFSAPTVGAALSAHSAAGQAMSEVAQGTGGEPILVLGKAADRLAEIGDRAAYTLSFRDPAGDHRYHEIRLACRRPGIRIDYRRGYRIPVEDERVLDTVVAGFLQPGQRSDPMSAAVTQSSATNSKKRPATALAIRYAPPLETGAAEERPVEVIAVGEDFEGNRTEPIQWSGTAERIEDGDAFETAVLLNVLPLYSWSVAVRDQPTGLTSYVFVPASGRP